MNLGTASVIRGNARDLPLADNSVDLVVTSPPYFALRSYQDGGEHYAGQIGDEPTPAEFVASLLEVTRECVRVLKPSGSLWVNLGDKYAGAPSGPQGSSGGLAATGYGDRIGGRRKITHAVPTKSLIGIPWRYALACIDDLGLILRAEVIWSKPNGLPESVTDRVRRSHEQWFHFTLEPRYFSAVDEIREAHDQQWAQRRFTPSPLKAKGNDDRNDGWSGVMRGEKRVTGNPLGKLPGSVWTIPTEPLRVPDHLGIDHFAAFPTEWPKRIIQGWSPQGVCVECGEGRRPVADVARVALTGSGGPSLVGGHGADGRVAGRARSEATITGYACACDPKVCRSCRLPSVPYCEGFRCCDSCTHGTLPDTRPSVILDPFGGTGTTALVAKALGRHGITVDMSADYCRLAEWRTNDRNQLAKVIGVEKAPEADVHQLDLFGEATA